VLRVLAVVVGALLSLGVLTVAVDSLVSTRLRRRRTLGDRLMRVQWRGFRWMAGRAHSEVRREAWLSSFPPLHLLSLIALWVWLQVLGWALIWWGIRPEGLASFGTSLYFSGVVYFTVGFGEIVPLGGLARALSLVEAFTGVTVVALVIGYLPALYAAFSQREHDLLLLDDGSEERITPLSLMVEFADGNDLASLDDTFRDWERWVAGILESHTSYPVLSYFRSQHEGQSWVTGLGLVTDAAVAAVAMRGEETGPAYRLYRRAVRTFAVVCDELHVTPYEGDPITRDLFRAGYDRWVDHGFAPPPFEVAWARMHGLRSAYAGHLEALIDHLAAPRGFWGHRIGRAGSGPGARSRVGRADG
jgi:hypothetical protein